MSNCNNLVSAMCTYVVLSSDYSTAKTLNNEVKPSGNGLYTSKHIVFTDDNQLTLSSEEPDLFDKWILTNFCLLAHNVHSLRNDDVFARRGLDVQEYNCMPVVRDLAVASVVKLVPGTTRLSKPIYAFDFRLQDDNLVLSPVEYNAFQLRMSKQSKKPENSPFAKDLKPIEFRSVALSELKDIYIRDGFKSVNSQGIGELSVVALHASINVDSGLLDDALNVSFEEEVLSYVK